MTYFTWLNGGMITVPDFPAWVCDICGKREYDHEAIDQLAMLLSPASEANHARVHSTRQPEQAHNKQHTSPIE